MDIGWYIGTHSFPTSRANSKLCSAISVCFMWISQTGWQFAILLAKAKVSNKAKLKADMMTILAGVAIRTAALSHGYRIGEINGSKPNNINKNGLATSPEL